MILASELNTAPGLRLFGEIIYPEWRLDRATAQEHLFDNDTTWHKVYPVKTPQQLHLQRPPDTREGRRINEIRAELQTMI